MKWLDKKNDPDWCQQFFAPVFGVAFLALGIIEICESGGGSTGYWRLGLGLLGLVMGFVHASRWRRKRRAFERGILDRFE